MIIRSRDFESQFHAKLTKGWIVEDPRITITIASYIPRRKWWVLRVGRLIITASHVIAFSKTTSLLANQIFLDVSWNCDGIWWRLRIITKAIKPKSCLIVDVPVSLQQANSNWMPSGLEEWSTLAPQHWQSLYFDMVLHPALTYHSTFVVNRVRTSHGICTASLARWGSAASAACDCENSRIQL